MLANILISAFFISVDLFLLAIAGLVRLFPSLLKFTRMLLREFMGLSFKLYKLILGRVAPILQNRWGVNILVGALRVISTVIMSLILGVLILWIFGFSITVFSLALCFLHGLVVGLVWGSVDHTPEGFHMGANVE